MVRWSATTTIQGDLLTRVHRACLSAANTLEAFAKPLKLWPLSDKTRGTGTENDAPFISFYHLLSSLINVKRSLNSIIKYHFYFWWDGSIYSNLFKLIWCTYHFYFWWDGSIYSNLFKLIWCTYHFYFWWDGSIYSNLFKLIWCNSTMIQPVNICQPMEKLETSVSCLKLSQHLLAVYRLWWKLHELPRFVWDEPQTNKLGSLICHWGCHLRPPGKSPLSCSAWAINVHNLVDCCHVA